MDRVGAEDVVDAVETWGTRVGEVRCSLFPSSLSIWVPLHILHGRGQRVGGGGVSVEEHKKLQAVSGRVQAKIDHRVGGGHAGARHVLVD
ncbi:hypothetical protein COCVIDRAFT_114534 [Bipolaris victoriae FI3]|uniref:Uncharacterized protein n=1 Tax=Bipolaris victoriae (strain FI3) TaxID=930091 RepID=W7EAV6_BIPV3|nr:hypothetical protein COCVIDRAFT_114534 [Bipolaris victoriae FI3]